MKKEIKKIKDLNKVSVELNALRKNLLNLKFQKTTGQLEKTSEIKKTRKKIAMLLTNIHQNKGSKHA